jgi:hypothetical protein
MKPLVKNCNFFILKKAQKSVSSFVISLSLSFSSTYNNNNNTKRTKSYVYLHTRAHATLVGCERKAHNQIERAERACDPSGGPSLRGGLRGAG